MKKVMFALLGALTALFALGALSTSGQVSTDPVIKCHFSFARPIPIENGEQSAGFGVSFPLEGEIVDQFQPSGAIVRLLRLTSLCTDADKTVEITNGGDDVGIGGKFGDDVLTCYQARQTSPFTQQTVDVFDQFIGEETVTLRRLERVCVFGSKDENGLVLGAGETNGTTGPSLNCYRISPERRLLIFERVEVFDQFDDKDDLVLWPVSLCTLGAKEFEGSEPIVFESGESAGLGSDTLMCYQILPRLTFEQVEVIDQFQFASVLALFSERLCVDAEKFIEE